MASAAERRTLSVSDDKGNLIGASHRATNSEPPKLVATNKSAAGSWAANSMLVEADGLGSTAVSSRDAAGSRDSSFSIGTDALGRSLALSPQPPVNEESTTAGEAEYDSDTAVRCIVKGCIPPPLPSPPSALPPSRDVSVGESSQTGGSEEGQKKSSGRARKLVKPIRTLKEWKGKRKARNRGSTVDEPQGVEMKNPTEDWKDIPLGPDPFAEDFKKDKLNTSSGMSALQRTMTPGTLSAGAALGLPSVPTSVPRPSMKSPPAAASAAVVRSPDLDPVHLDTIFRMCSGYEPAFDAGTTAPTASMQALREYVSTLSEDHLQRYYLKCVALQTEAATADIDVGASDSKATISRLKRNLTAKRIQKRRLGDLPRICVQDYEIVFKGEDGGGVKVKAESKATIHIQNTGKGKCLFSLYAFNSPGEYRLSFDPPSATLKKNASIAVEATLVCYTPGKTFRDIFFLEEETNNRIIVKWVCDVENSFFGVPLSVLPMVKVLDLQVPKVLEDLKEYMVSHGALQCEGIFRVESSSERERVRDQVNAGKPIECKEVSCVASLLKEWFRYLPGNIFNTLPLDMMCNVANEKDCLELIEGLEQERKDLLHWLLDLMADVCKEEEKNKMNARNLSIVFAPNLIESPSTMDMLVKSKQVVRFLYLLLAHRLRTKHNIRVPAEP